MKRFPALGLTTGLLYVLVAGVFWTDAVFDSSGSVKKLIFAVAGMQTILYFAGIRMLHAVRARVVLFGAGFGLIGFVSGPVDSTDLYFYMAQG